MQRYAHPYGGTATVIGEFPAQEIMDWLVRRNMAPMYMLGLMDGMRHNLTASTGFKVLDIIEDDREILIYSKGKGTSVCRIEVINRK